MNAATNPLIKSVADEFVTAQGRSTARDGLNEQ
jgi:hypothetical protein